MFYIICGAIKNRDKIKPYLTDTMIRDAMKHPIYFGNIIKFKKYLFVNIGFWIIGSMPAYLSVKALTILGKLKRLL